MFGKIFNMNTSENNLPDYMEVWEKTFEGFEKSLRQSMGLFPFFPRDDYQAAIQKCVSLEKTVADQEDDSAP